MDTAGDGAIGVELSLHVVSTADVVAATDVLLGVSNSEKTKHSTVTDSGWGARCIFGKLVLSFYD